MSSTGEFKKCQKRVGSSNCCSVLYCSVPNRMVGVYIYQVGALQGEILEMYFKKKDKQMKKFPRGICKQTKSQSVVYTQ